MQKLVISFLVGTAIATTALADDALPATTINVAGTTVGEVQKFPFPTTVALSLSSPGVLELPMGGSFVLPPITPTMTAAPVGIPLAPLCLPLGMNPYLLPGQIFRGQFPTGQSSGFFPFQAWTLEPPLNSFNILALGFSMTQNMPTCTGLTAAGSISGGLSGGLSGATGTAGRGLGGAGGSVSGGSAGIGAGTGAGLGGAGGSVSGGSAGIGAGTGAGLGGATGTVGGVAGTVGAGLGTAAGSLVGYPGGNLASRGASSQSAGSNSNFSISCMGIGSSGNTGGSIGGALGGDISGVVNGAVSNVTGSVSGALGNVTGTINGALRNVSGTINGAVSNISGTINGTVSHFTGLVNGVLVTNFTGPINGVISNATGTINGALSNATGNLNGAVSHLTGTVNGALSNATGTINGALSNATGVVNGAINGPISGALGNLSGAIAGTTGGINIGSSINGIGGDCGQGQTNTVPTQSSKVIHFVPQMGLTPVIIVLPKIWDGYASVAPVQGTPVALPGADAKHTPIVLAGYTSLCADNIPPHVSSEDINPVWPCTKHADPGTCSDGDACVNGKCGNGGICTGYIPAVTTNTPRGAVTLFAQNTSMSTILPALPPLPDFLQPPNAPTFGQPMPLLQPVGCPLGDQDPAPSPSLPFMLDQQWPCYVRGQEIMTGLHGTLDKPESQLNLTVYWVCLDDTEFQLDPTTINFTYQPAGFFGFEIDTDHGAPCSWQWLPQFAAAVISYPTDSPATTADTSTGASSTNSSNVTVSSGSTPPKKGNLAVETLEIVVNATTLPTTIPGITPPANSYMSIPMGTPVAFDMSVAGSTITLPAGGDITDAEGGMINMPQRSVLIALGPDPSSPGRVGVVSGFLLNTGQYATNNQIRLPGNSSGTSPLIPYNNGGNVTLSYDQLEGWGNTILSPTDDTGTILEYPLKESQLQISTTEVGVPPDAVVPIPSVPGTATTAVAVPAAIATPQDLSTLTDPSATPASP